MPSIGAGVAALAILSLATGFPLTLGIDDRSTVLLLLSLFVTSISIATGRTTVLQGPKLTVTKEP